MSQKDDKSNRMDRREMLAKVKAWSMVALSLPVVKAMGVGAVAMGGQACVYTDDSYSNYGDGGYSNGYSAYSNYSDSGYSNYSNYSNYSDYSD